jgi:class 3 adenylate cyclase
MYDYLQSINRLKEIIFENEYVYEELSEIPNIEKLTFTNGFYVNCSVLAIDICKSSKLPDIHNRPKLAKIYRSFISESIAVMKGNNNCQEVFIEGDGIIGIFNTKYQKDIDNLITTAAQLSSLIDIINCLLQKQSIKTFQVGIGMDFGRALLIKAGFKGSGINNVVWLGEAVNYATKLSKLANRSYFDYEIFVSNAIYQNLHEENQKYFTYNSQKYCYHGSVKIILMADWIQENC